jgi:hypothetical protein
MSLSHDPCTCASLAWTQRESKLDHSTTTTTSPCSVTSWQGNVAFNCLTQFLSIALTALFPLHAYPPDSPQPPSQEQTRGAAQRK